MTDIGTAVSFLVAVNELAQVKSIRRGVKENLIAKGGIEGPLGNIDLPKPLGVRTRESQAPIGGGYDRGHHPRTCMPVPTVRTSTLVEHVPAVPAADQVTTLPAEPHRHREHGPLVPPWQMPLVPDTSWKRPIIKCPPPPPDVISKGLLLDFFM